MKNLGDLRLPSGKYSFAIENEKVFVNGEEVHYKKNQKGIPVVILPNGKILENIGAMKYSLEMNGIYPAEKQTITKHFCFDEIDNIFETWGDPQGKKQALRRAGIYF